MTIFTVFFAVLLANFKFAAFVRKQKYMGWKRSVLQNPDRERTNQSTGICLRLALPYNNAKYAFQYTFNNNTTQYDDIFAVCHPFSQFLPRPTGLNLSAAITKPSFARVIARYVFLVLISKILVLGVLLITLLPPQGFLPEDPRRQSSNLRAYIKESTYS